MADDLHSFITGTLLLKLKADVEKLYASSRPELVASTYFQIRRLLLVQPGWACRVSSAPTGFAPDLKLYQRDGLRAAIQLEFPDSTAGFPSRLFEDRLDMLRRAVATAGVSARGYLIAAFDSAEAEMYPDEARPERQTCYWLPINCREFSAYDEWHTRWLKLTAP